MADTDKISNSDREVPTPGHHQADTDREGAAAAEAQALIYPGGRGRFTRESAPRNRPFDHFSPRFGERRRRTLMGPSALIDPRAPKAPDPLRSHLLKRAEWRKVWGLR